MVLEPEFHVAVECRLSIPLSYPESRPFVFVHPRDWARISLRDGVLLKVKCEGHEVEAEVSSWGEFYRSGRVTEETTPSLNLEPGEYEAEAQIVWEKALPPLVLEELQRNEKVRTAWQKQPLETIRAQISTVRRAQSEITRKTRELKLIEEIRSLSSTAE